MDEALKCAFDRRFLTRFSRVSPPIPGEKHAEVTAVAGDRPVSNEAEEMP
jgi:hypothetical protein